MIMDTESKEYLTIGEVAGYLGWSVRFVEGLVRGEKLSAHEVNGEWRFSREELVDWLNRKLQTLDVIRIGELESTLEGELLADGTFQRVRADRLSSQLPLDAIDLDVTVQSKIGVLQHLVHLAERSSKLDDREALYVSLLEREALYSTALPQGVAICHPRKPLPSAIRGYALAFLRTHQPVHFGADDGEGTYLFFLFCAPDERAHLHGLARLARILTPSVIAALKMASSAADVLGLIHGRELEITDDVKSD